MRICFFDLETRKKPEELAAGSLGWDKLKQGQGGITILALWDSQEEWCYFYDDHKIEDVATHLEAADLVVGFNSEGFDIPVVEGLLGRKLKIKKHIDLSECIRNAHLKLNYPLRKGENKLKTLAQRVLGKTILDVTGALAPDMWKEGKIGEVVNYCAHDTRYTRDLYYHIEKEGGIVSVNGTFIPVTLDSPRVPQEEE